MEGQDGQATAVYEKRRRRQLAGEYLNELGIPLLVREGKFSDMERQRRRSQVFESGSIVAKRKIAKVQRKSLHLWHDLANSREKHGVYLGIEFLFIIVFDVETR